MIRLLIGLLGVAAGAQAQVPVPNTPDAFWQTPAPVANEAMIRQAGAGNQAVMAVMAGSQNRLELNQTANANAASLRVTGQANSLLLNQNGDGNRLDLGLNGNDNRLKITQNGGDMASLPGLTGSNAKLELIQRNGTNTFIADGPTALGTSAGPGAANLRIEQTGGSTVHIQTGRPIGQ